MRGNKTAELLPWLRLSRAAALLAFIAVLAQALVPSWMPVFAATPGQGLSVVICTAMGPMQMQIGPDGKPVDQAPPGQGSDHQCCPCVTPAKFAPPANTIVFVVLQDLGTTRIVWAAQESPGAISHTPHSPRAPPSFA
jgi:DUF2946 family protein